MDLPDPYQYADAMDEMNRFHIIQAHDRMCKHLETSDVSQLIRNACTRLLQAAYNYRIDDDFDMADFALTECQEILKACYLGLEYEDIQYRIDLINGDIEDYLGGKYYEIHINPWRQKHDRQATEKS